MISIRSYRYKISFLLVLLFLSAEGFSQLILGAEALALGQANTARMNNRWAVFSNPAAMHSDKAALSFYSLRNYGIIALTDMAASGSYPTDYGIAAFGIHKYGDDLFSEIRIRIGYANSLANLSAGVVANFNTVSFGGTYRSARAFGLDIGLLASLSEKFALGARATNINQPGYDDEVEYLPRELAIGLEYQMEQSASFSFDVVKDVRFPVSYRAGIELLVVPGLKGRMGMMTGPITYSLGTGYRTSSWEVNLAVQKHEYLGVSPGIDLSLFFEP